MGTPSTITSTTTNTVTTESHTHAIEKASIAVAGVVKLIDTLTSTSTEDAATARTVKALNDAKVEKSTVITAGNGLTGGGDLNASRTITLGTPGNLTESTANTVTVDSHTHFLTKASTSEAGIVKLNDTLVSTSVVEAATARQAKALNDSKADKSVTINVGWGLTGGGNLAANRTIELNLAQLDTRYAASGVGGSYVPLTRSLTAGTGLSGGGDLPANRSFSVVYGTDGGTVAQGNDSRINNGQTAFSWGNHAAQAYLRTVALRSSSGLLGNGTNAADGLGLDYNAIDARYVKSSGGTITGDLTVTGRLNASNLDQGIPTGTILWFNCLRSALPDGFVALDGQLANRADFPDLWAMISSNRLNNVLDGLWNSMNADSTRLNYRASYSTGTNGSNFRFPDLNGVHATSLKSPVLRGDGYRSSGAILGDAIRNITGEFSGVVPRSSNIPSLVFNRSGANFTGVDGNGNAQQNYNFDASRVVPTSDENRPVSAFGVYAVKARGGTNTIPAAGSPATLLANTFNGSQKIVGDLEVTGSVKFGFLSDLLSSKEPNGYQQLPGGLILQWGKTVSVGDEQTRIVPFNIAFPKRCLNIQLTENIRSTWANHASHVVAYAETTTEFTMFMNSTLAVSTSCNWWAIGE